MEAAASVLAIDGVSAMRELMPLACGARRPPHVSTAAHEDDGRDEFARDRSTMSQDTGTTGRSSDASSPALALGGPPDQPRLAHQHTDMADMIATPRVNISKDDDNLWSSFNTDVRAT